MLFTLLERAFNGLAFYTRLPCPSWVQYGNEQLNRASAFFPLIGTLLGCLVFGSFYLSHQIFNVHISLLVAIIASILLTGAFHEDGFADLCDGFGGGWHKDDVLRIMKDSRLGTYGVIGLISILSLKWLALTSLPISQLFVALVIGYTLSRAFAISLIMILPYVQDDQASKAKPIAQQWHIRDMLFAWGSTLLVCSLLNWQLTLIMVTLGGVHLLWIRQWFKHRLGGYTGDALGAAQQIFEVSFYLAMSAFFAA
ncbi:adenosylcobinamide-GDP ribazoletransferase [Bermanella marisrubri]|uniref:Adenosylcobinamide-GDP ribazoletransferase n=1 Tax=Bermanella marisrubri TaxID=207949 RepID=Q1MXH3_9GAMM|nr:adenosylcobinamide-GDP ribazoletransferase [Bermanella marisrubri]EAT10671.1 cobalamin synthase [Oceanobacter sp. RED65] [Bermanella marisrubri]QIZ83361.1 adenosylcobinamide-GDP ribazoletransferase [Bermanella marisrubri]